jgi:hypothetical protein
MKNKLNNLFGNNKAVRNNGVKYSELLEQFLDHFGNKLAEEDTEDIIEMAISAWNTANIKAIMRIEEFANKPTPIPDEDNAMNLFDEMVNYKINTFKKHTRFILNYEIKTTDNDPILRVITEESESYMNKMLNTVKEEPDQDDYEENYIDRHAIVLRPLQPFIDWRSNLHPDDEMGEVSEANIYLVTNEIDDLEAYLKKAFDTFFMMELDDWLTNKKEWPQKRNYKMFKQWFQIETSSMVYDLEKKPIFKSE